MKEKIKKILVTSFLIGMPFIFLINSENVAARNLKSFVVEKSGSDFVLISDGSSQYIIDHDYNCYDSEFSVGLVIYIDTYFSPSYGDDIIIPGYTNTVCEVTDSDSVNIKQYYVDNVFDSEDKIIVSNNSGKYLVEYGIGCGLSMWRYEGKNIDIDIGGSFLDGIGDTIYLLDSGRNCRVWDVDELSGGGSGSYNPASNLSNLCPANSQYFNGNCVCTDGYLFDGNNCITHTQDCINSFGQNVIGTKGDNNNSSCNCSSGYQWNSSKTACVAIACPINSFNSDGQCRCNFGYILKDGSCVSHTTICKEQFGIDSYGDGTNCYCNIDSQWNSSKTACIKIQSTPTPTEITPIAEVKKEPIVEPKEEPKQLQQNTKKDDVEIKSVAQEENKSYPDIKKEENNNQKKTGFIASISNGFKNIFNSIGNFFSRTFK